jgi:hypothetical protein
MDLTKARLAWVELYVKTDAGSDCRGAASAEPPCARGDAAARVRAWRAFSIKAGVHTVWPHAVLATPLRRGAVQSLGRRSTARNPAPTAEAHLSPILKQQLGTRGAAMALP